MDFHCYRGRVVIILVLVAVLDQQMTVESSSVSTCSGEYADRTPKHTMCLTDSDNVLEAGVSDADKIAIVDFHNKARRETEPKATDLAAVIWDDKIAAVAQKLSQQCRLYHDPNAARVVPSYGLKIGQSVAAGSANWMGAMGTWFAEKDLFKFGQDPNQYLGKNGWRKIGHYSMMVSNRVHRVGCGFSKCSNGRFYVCNYAQSQINFRRPYTNGTERCSKCKESCNNGLCDCGGKLCFNNGKLNIDTCACKCTKIYREADCSRLECPQTDYRSCGTKWPEAYCKKYSNVPVDCPIMCGTCPA